MPTATHTAPDRITADVRQLVSPIVLAAGRALIRHPPLLDQLRQAAIPGRGAASATTRHAAAGSRPPANLDAVDVLAEIYVGISVWHVRLRLASPPRDQDWQAAVLRALADTAPTLDPPVAEWLAVEVHGWWTDAATASGWRPADLLRLR